MRLLDNWIHGYLRSTQNNEAPEHFHFWMAVGVIGAALRRKTYIDMGDWQWSPNFYIIFVAEPGIVNKSTTLRIGKRMLAHNEGIHIGPSSITWQALIEILSSASEEVPMGDGTLHPMACVSFFVSELGVFMDFNDRKMIDVLVDLWDGDTGSWERATQYRGREGVVNPWLNIMSGTTPAWLADNLPRQMIGGGFASRCIWVHGHQKKAYIPYPKRHPKYEGKEILDQQLVMDLMRISALRGEFKLTEKAFQYGEAWYLKHCKNLEKQVARSSGMAGYYARKQAHAHKLAMVLSAARRDDLVIDEEDLEQAIKILDATEQDYAQVFQAITTTTTMEQTSDVVKLVIQRGKIRKAELYQYFFHAMTAKEFNESIESAIVAGYLALEQSGSTIFVTPGAHYRKRDGSSGTNSSTAESGEAPFPEE
jgi:hypothetical protein